jgi:hypothetical protein
MGEKRQQEVVSHYRPPSHPEAYITCLPSQKRDTVDAQAGGLNFSKTFIKT